MDRSIYTALNSMNILRDNQSVTAQNLANISVTGFQKDIQINFSSVYLDRDKGIDPRVLALQEPEPQTCLSLEASSLSEIFKHIFFTSSRIIFPREFLGTLSTTCHLFGSLLELKFKLSQLWIFVRSPCSSITTATFTFSPKISSSDPKHIASTT